MRPVYVEWNGETHSVAEWSRITGIPYKCLWYRLQRGWPVEDAFNQNERWRRFEKVDGKLITWRNHPPVNAGEIKSVSIGGRAIALTPLRVKRFLGKLRRDERTGCLLWTACKHTFGYGIVTMDGVTMNAHRVAFVLGGGVLTEEKPYVLHGCPSGDNPACCEFGHLRAGTHADNMADMSLKGRGHASKTGLPYGVSKAPSGRYRVQVKIGGRMTSFGTFATVDAAYSAAVTARESRYLSQRS